MKYQELIKNNFKYIWLQHKEGNYIGTLQKIAIVTDKMLEGYAYDPIESDNKDIAVYNQL